MSFIFKVSGKETICPNDPLILVGKDCVRKAKKVSSSIFGIYLGKAPKPKGYKGKGRFGYVSVSRGWQIDLL